MLLSVDRTARIVQAFFTNSTERLPTLDKIQLNKMLQTTVEHLADDTYYQRLPRPPFPSPSYVQDSSCHSDADES